MATERTLAIIKPDAVEARNAGPILTAIEEAGFDVVAMKKARLTNEQARAFYEVHEDKPFYGSLTSFMSSGPVVLMVLEADGAIKRWRDLMGPTNAEEAGPETLRGRFGANIERNAVHGSDAPETAAFETAFFFSAFERL